MTPYRNIAVEESTQVGSARREAIGLAAGLGPDGYETLIQASNLLGWAHDDRALR